jgi:hypothetical protein
MEISVKVVYPENAGDANTVDGLDLEWFQKISITYTAPTEKIKTSPNRCLTGTLTVHNVRIGQRKMRKSLTLLRAWAE